MAGRPMVGLGTRSAVGAIGASLLMIAVFGPMPAALVIFTALFLIGLFESAALGLRLGVHRYLTFVPLILYLLAVSPNTVSATVPASVAVGAVLLVLVSIRHAGLLARLYPFLVAAGFASAYLLKGLAGGGALLAVFCVTWASDMGAYFVGLRFGRRQLAPAISPGKTWEGSAGGFAAALVIGLVAGRLLDQWFFGLLLGLAGGTLGQIGDLAESRLKRLANVKDSGAIFPGHGGVLDRFDAFLVNASVAFALWVVLG